MRGKQFTEEQIIGVLKEAEAGMPLPEVLRKHGIAHGRKGSGLPNKQFTQKALFERV